MVARGSVVLESGSGNYGKIRPAIVVQNDRALRWSDSLTVCLLTSDLSPNNPVRLPIMPSETNGLKQVSDIQIDRVQTFRKSKARDPIGTLTPEEMIEVDLALALHLNLFALASSGEQT